MLYGDGLIRTVDAATQTIVTVAGGSSSTPTVGGAAAAVRLVYRQVGAVARTTDGEVSWSNSIGQVFSVSPAGLIVREVSGHQPADSPGGRWSRLRTTTPPSSTHPAAALRLCSRAGGLAGSLGADGVAATSAVHPNLVGVAVDQHSGDIFTSEASRIRRISATDGLISTLAGTLTSGPFQQPPRVRQRRL